MSTTSELNFRFEKELWPLNPMSSKTGSKEKTLIELQYHIASKQMNGKPVDFDLIRDKYAIYFDFIKSGNVGVDQRFQTKPLSIQDWIAAEKYREDVTMLVDQRDIYLYGE